MPNRYAVLLDKAGEDVRPVGIAVEHSRGVFVDLPDAYGVPFEHVGEYRVLQPGLTEVLYRPGDPGYLDQVLVDLFWGFAIGEVGELAELTRTSYARLRARVMAEREQQRSEAYASDPVRAPMTYEAAEVESEPARAAAADDLALVA